MKDWRKYERYVAFLCSEEFASDNTTVIPNARIIGKSGSHRQVDVLVEKKYDLTRSRRLIVDAKRYKKRVDIKDVETFEGMMRDCGASRGILVCPEGYTEGALRRAREHISIRLVPLDDIDGLSLDRWEECLSERCSRRSSRGLVLWDSPYGIVRHDGMQSISCVAKCDGCGSFHIWCWGCGEKFSLGDEDEHKCGCDGDWFWLTAVEEDIDDQTGERRKAVYLLLPSLRDYVQGRPPITVDVRPVD